MSTKAGDSKNELDVEVEFNGLYGLIWQTGSKATNRV
jgi:hypothetical protein